MNNLPKESSSKMYRTLLNSVVANRIIWVSLFVVSLSIIIPRILIGGDLRLALILVIVPLILTFSLLDRRILYLIFLTCLLLDYGYWFTRVVVFTILGRTVYLIDFFIFFLTLPFLLSSIMMQKGIGRFTYNSLISSLFTVVWFLSFVRGIPIYGAYAIGESRWYFSSILYFITAFFITDLKTLKRIIFIIALVSLLSLAIIYLQIFGFLESRKTVGADRYGELMINNDILFGFLVLMVYFLRLRLNKQKINIYPFWGSVIILQISALLIANLRAQIVGLFVSVLFLAFIERKKMPKILFLVLLSILFFSFAVPVTMKNTTWRYLELAYTRESTAGWRLMYWQHTLSEIFSDKVATVIGFPMGKPILFVEPGGFVRTEGAHNDFIEIMHKTGVIGLGLFITIVGSFLKRGIAFLKMNPNNEYGRIMLVVMLFLVTHLTICFFGGVIRHPGIGLFYWIFMGMGDRLIKLKSRDHLLYRDKVLYKSDLMSQARPIPRAKLDISSKVQTPFANRHILEIKENI